MSNEPSQLDDALVKRMTTNTVAVAADLKPDTTLLIYSIEKGKILKVPFSVLVATIKAS